MTISIPYNIGDKLPNGEKIRGAHIYVGENGKINSFRFHIGDGKFITLPAERKIYNE